MERKYKKISDLENEADLLFLSWVADASASINTIWTSPRPEYINRLAREYRELKAEREKNPGVWDGAPENANRASVSFWQSPENCDIMGLVGEKAYTRTLPKTKAREIAEKAGREFPSNDGFITMDRKTLAEVVLNAINEALAGGGK